MTSPSVVLELADGIAHLRLNRPQVRNALRADDVALLHRMLDQIEHLSARAVVLSGEGPAFCAGRDLSDADPANEDARAILADTYNPLLSRIHYFAVPTFAAVHGACLGVGLGLALACDVAIVADGARLGSPFARIGAVLDSGGHHHLVRRLGEHRARELIYTGRLLTGTEAAQWGLVNRAVPDDRLLDEVLATARKVAAGPTQAFRLSRSLAHRVTDECLSFDAVLAAESDAQWLASHTHDYTEGITAFQHKREPRFTGAPPAGSSDNRGASHGN
jgi:2-(1,2-epoxy-1,2-dihydrophenyl)acetyl-CoA isomerase